MSIPARIHYGLTVPPLSAIARSGPARRIAVLLGAGRRRRQAAPDVASTGPAFSDRRVLDCLQSDPVHLMALR